MERKSLFNDAVELFSSQNFDFSLLANIVDKTPIPSIIVDSSTFKIIYLNREAETLFSKWLKQENELNLSSLIESKNDFDKLVELISKPENPHQLRFNIELKLSEPSQAKVTLQKSEESKQNIAVLYFELVENDNSTKQQKSLEEENEELKRLNHLKDKVFSQIVHDLKGPIGNLQSAMKMMIEMKNSLSEDEFETFLNSVNKSLGDVYYTLGLLTHWAEIELGKKDIKLEKVNIDHILKEINTKLKSKLDSKKINLEINSAVNTLTLVDRTLFGVVLEYLLENSIKSLKENGIIKIESEIKNENVLLRIKDNGLGISEEKIFILNNLLKKNIDVSSFSKNKFSLGDVLCNKIISLHNGSIEFKSKPKEGTEVELLLPGVES